MNAKQIVDRLLEADGPGGATLALTSQDGKPLPKRWTATLQRLIQQGVMQPNYPGGAVEKRNPFSGVKRSLTPVAAALLDFIVTPDPYGANGLTRSDWDNARYIFHVCWPDEYYDLVD